MRNLRLLATILFVAVLLVGIVLLLRQTNTQNDTSVTSTTQTANTQLATNNLTDPPVKGGLKAVRNNNSDAAVQSKLNSLKKAKTLKTEGAKNIELQSTPNSYSKFGNKHVNPSTSIEWNPTSSKQDQIKALETMIRNESNPAIKTKYQTKLNTLK